MQIPTITLRPEIARVHYADYRKKCRANREKRRADAVKVLSQIDNEDKELLKAYRALSRGEQLLNVGSVILNVGMDGDMLPKLAMCKADVPTCYLMFRGSRGFFSPIQNAHWNRTVWKDGNGPTIFKFGDDANKFSEYWRTQNNKPNSAKALVPSVPPHLRPDDLSKYWILWEAEWTDKAPGDPILLSRVNQTMFAVVAQWDLTPIEQQVLEGRFR